MNDAGFPTRGPIRVCFVIDRLSRAGTETQLLQLIQRLDRTRVEPRLCLLDGRDEVSESLLPKDCPTLRLGVRRLASLHALRQGVEFQRFLKRERIDIVQTYFTDSTRFAAPIAKTAGVGAVFGSRRNVGHAITRFDGMLARLYNHWFIDQIVANCDAARRAVIEQEGARPAQVQVVPNVLDLDRFSDLAPWRAKSAGSLHKVGMVGNLRPVKGADLFIRAVRTVLRQFPGTTFEIAGGGNPQPYQLLIDEQGLSGNVRLLGEVVDVPGFLGTLDIAVLPSRAEGQSNALLEYMAAGRPIVATNVGGNAELVFSGRNGLLVMPDESELAAAIVRLLANPQLAAGCAQAAYEAVSSRSPEQVADRMTDLFARALGAPIARIGAASAPRELAFHE